MIQQMKAIWYFERRWWEKTRDLLIFPQQFYPYQSLVRKNTEERDKIIHLVTGQVTLVLKPAS